MDLPDHVRLVRLPVLYMNETFTRLIPGEPGYRVGEVQDERRRIIYSLFEEKRPDIFIVELYPFGRSIFGAELEPLLQHIREAKFGNMKVVCSLRDILVEKKDPAAYESRVLEKLNRYFDLLLIHSDPGMQPLDETFGRLADIKIPLEYAGFISQRADPAAGVELRRELGVSTGGKLIVASAGGGRSGYKLLDAVLEAFDLLREHSPAQLEIFCGPFMDQDEYEKLAVRSAPGRRIRRYTKRFVDYLSAADLSVSLAGYNTCMNLLATKVPALVFPYARQQEQPMRAEKMKKYLPMAVLDEADLQPDTLCRHMTQMLDREKAGVQVPVNLNGASNAARFLDEFCSK